ncbi:hypothetical protein D917_03246 [Trichinella nativa]|uniref:Uncharacterized protein n=1 Tax=Trichinella nativa TaxID=6335 RepID=A0A1Y3ECK5_9BILA|nr:hypothetical protein D917_03246 [Trichinella nativa]
MLRTVICPMTGYWSAVLMTVKVDHIFTVIFVLLSIWFASVEKEVDRGRLCSLLAGRQVLHQRGAICRCHLDEKPRRTMTAQVDTHIIPLTIGKPIHWTSACSTEVVNGSEDQNQRRCERAQQDLIFRLLAVSSEEHQQQQQQLAQER